MLKKFPIKILVLMTLMVIMTFGLQKNFFWQVVGWALIAYILLQEVVDYFADMRRKRRRYRWPIIFSIHHIKLQGDNKMEFQIHEDEVLPFRLGKPIDSQGNEAPIEDGSFKEGVVDPNIFTVEQDDEQPTDPEAKMFVAKSKGITDYNASGDADLGAGVETISVKVTGTVIAAGAVGFAPIQFGAIRKKKAAEGTTGTGTGPQRKPSTS